MFQLIAGFHLLGPEFTALACSNFVLVTKMTPKQMDIWRWSFSLDKLYLAFANF